MRPWLLWIAHVVVMAAISSSTAFYSTMSHVSNLCNEAGGFTVSGVVYQCGKKETK